MFKTALLFIALCFSTQAMAAGLDVSKIPKPKVLQFVPQAQFEKDTDLITEKNPDNDQYVSYSIRLPKGWTGSTLQPAGDSSGKDKVATDVLNILGKYTAPPKNLLRSYLTIEAESVGYEISAKNWLINFVLSNGFSLLTFEEKSDRAIEASYVQVIDDQTYVVRTLLQINGSRLVLVRYYLPQENYEGEKIQQAQVIDSFKLTQQITDNVEQHAGYAFMDQSYFNYPQSWTLKDNKALSIERMNATLLQSAKEGKRSLLEGQIKVNVISKLLGTKMTDEIATWKKDFKVNNYTIGGLIESLAYKYDTTIKSGKTQVYKLVPSDPVDMKLYEVAVTIMEGDDYYYIVSLVTPSRDVDFLTWARNIEAYKIVCQSLRRFQ